MTNNGFISTADQEDELTVEIDMKSYKFFTQPGGPDNDIQPEVREWFRDTIGPESKDYKAYKAALAAGERTYMLEFISTTGISCCYITFTKKSDVTLFKLAWSGQRGQVDE